MWTFVAFHGTFPLIGLMLSQFELDGYVQLRSYIAITFYHIKKSLKTWLELNDGVLKIITLN